jgi:hypothetical protein
MLMGRCSLLRFGTWGKTYIVPSDRQQHLRRFFQVFNVVMLITIVVAVQFVGWWVVALVPLFLLVLYSKYWAFCRGLEVVESAPAQLSRSEALSIYSRAIGRSRIWFCIVVTILFAVVGVWMIYTRGGAEPYFVTVGSVPGLIISLRMLRAIRV